MRGAIVHASVLVDEAVRGLLLGSESRVIDATSGLGGHSEAILETTSPSGRVLAVDRDPVAIQLARERLRRFGDRIVFVEGHFSDIARHADRAGFIPVDGVIADLGVSSLQLDDASRGFSFSREGPLDMRMGPGVGRTAADLLARFDVDSLADVLREFGEMPRAHAIARAILEARDRDRLATTRDLAAVIERASGHRGSSSIHPATRAFQAIRIAVNRELDELDALLEALPSIVAPGGRVAIISFHSLEDRLVKRAFLGPEAPSLPRGLPTEPLVPPSPWNVVTKKPIVPSEHETRDNPRARSAKLRIAERRR